MWGLGSKLGTTFGEGVEGGDWLASVGGRGPVEAVLRTTTGLATESAKQNDDIINTQEVSAEIHHQWLTPAV